MTIEKAQYTATVTTESIFDPATAGFVGESRTTVHNYRLEAIITGTDPDDIADQLDTLSRNSRDRRFKDFSIGGKSL